MIFVNFKTYQQASGPNAVKLALICQEVAKTSKVPIIPCVQAVDLASVASAVAIPVWVQHIDPVNCGKTTGFITGLSVKLNRGAGTLLNHSEHCLGFDEIKICLKVCQKRNLKTMVLVGNLSQAAKINELVPDYIGLEEPSLIGGKIAMVNLASECEKIKKFVKLVNRSQALIGAGINKKSDIQASLALGAKGVLMASAVVLAPYPKKTLLELASAF